MSKRLSDTSAGGNTPSNPPTPQRAAGVSSEELPGVAETNADRLYRLDEAFQFGSDGHDIVDSVAAVPSLRGHTDAIRCIAFDGPSGMLFTASWDETVLVWDAANQLEIGILPHGAWVNGVAVSRFPAAATSSKPPTPGDGDSSALKVLTVTEEGHLTVWQQCPSPRGGFEFLVGGQWRLSHGALTGITVSADAAFCVSIDRVYGFSLASGTLMRQYRAEADLCCAVALPEHLYCGLENGNVVCFDVVGGFALRQLTGHTGEVRALIAQEKYNTIYSAGEDGSIRAWLLSTGQCTKVWRVHKKPVMSLALHFSTHGRFLYSASADGLLKCTRLSTGVSTVARNCTSTAMLVIEVLDPDAIESDASPEAAAALSHRRSSLVASGITHGRRKSLLEAAKEQLMGRPVATTSASRLFCGDYRGSLYAFPLEAAEAAAGSSAARSAPTTATSPNPKATNL